MKSEPSVADREIVISRVVNAPRELVWEVFTRREHVGEWWGPNGFTLTIHEMDVRPGGVWRFIMHGPNGVDYPNFVRYTEVVKPERLVFDHGKDEKHIFFRMTITFAAQGDRTVVTMRQLYDTPEARDHAVKVIKAVEGGNQTFDRLEAYLAKM